MRRSLFALALLGVAACKKEPAAAAPVDSSIVAYCGKSCRDYDQAVARLRTLASPDSGPGCSRGEIGQCDQTRWIAFSDGFSGFEEWFGPSGQMVGARTFVDVRPEPTTFGTPMSCRPAVKEDLCKR